MTSRRRTKALREAGLDRRSRAARVTPEMDAAARAKAQGRARLRLAPPVARGRRRAKGFRQSSQPLGPARFPTAKATPHPMAMTGERGRPVSHTNFIRRAAKRNAAARPTRASILASARLQDPTATRSAVSRIKRRSYRHRGLQDSINRMIGNVDAVTWGDPVVPTERTRAESRARLEDDDA